MARATARIAPTATFAVTATAPLLDHAGVEAARLVHVARAKLVAEEPSVTYRMLARARHQKEMTVRQWFRRLRSDGAVVSVDYDGKTLIPSFQFDEAYELIPAVSRVVSRLTGLGMSGWAVWRWFAVEHPAIEERPVALIAAGGFDELDRLAARFVDDACAG